MLDANGETPLLSAVKENNMVLATLLREVGADVTLADHNGWTALHYAAERRNHPMVTFLLEAGADIEATTRFKETPLIVAALVSNNVPMVVLLLQRGADINAKDDGGHGIEAYLTIAEMTRCRDI